MSRPAEPFRPYHRARAIAAAVRIGVLSTLAVAVLGGLVVLGIAQPDTPAIADARPAAVAPDDAAAGNAPPPPPPDDGDAPDGDAGDRGAADGGDRGGGALGGATTEPDTLPADAADPEASSEAPAAPPAAPEQGDGDGTADTDPLSIAVDTVGHQDEIDRCLWVRMDFGSVDAPIVGAHNYCGGHVVLDLRAGDRVALSGTGLDGAYVVTGDREVVTGSGAASATEGLAADVILQTCFWNTGTTRLVTLARV